MGKIKIFILIFGLLILTNIVHGLDDATTIIGSKVLNQWGLKGDGNTICIIDTGVDYTHPNLGGCTSTQFLNGDCSKIIGGYDFGNDDPDPMDNIGHGTIVSGIVGSNNSTYRGVAPNSKIVMLKIVNDSWTAASQVSDKFFLNVKRAMRWCIDNSSKYNISSISMSIGNMSSIYADNCNDAYSLGLEIKDARSKNIPIIVASGNDFSSTNPIEGLGYPACLANVTSVGATTNRKSMASFSNRAEGLNLVAPGVDIKSTKLGGGYTKIGDRLFGCVPILNLIFTCTDGTSFSTPEVSAAVALIKQYDPAIRSFEVEDMLESESDQIFDTVTFRNYNRINLLKALHVYDWPTDNHNFRRTGFTLLRGDLNTSQNAKTQVSFILDIPTGTARL